MPLTNSQYDAVLRLYNERQLRNRREQDRRVRAHGRDTALIEHLQIAR